MAIDIFDTRKMIRMLDEAKPAHTFLRDRYFSNVETFTTAKLDIDIRQGKRRIAPFVHPKIGGKNVESRGYRTETFEAPEVSPEMLTTAEDLLKRSAGENVYGATDPNTRAARKLGEDLAELDEIITRREEVMCAEALFKGQVTVKGDGYDEVIKYWPTDVNDAPYTALGAADRWSADTSDPLSDFRLYRRGIIQKSGVTPTDALLGTDAIEALLANASFTKKLDNRRIDLGIIDPSILPDGVTYWGYLKDSALDLWSYDEWYIDEADGEEKPMVPAKEVLIGSPRVRTTMAYGCVLDVEKGSFALPRVPLSWTQRKPTSGRVAQIKSRPLPIIHQIDGFHVLKVLG
jgi:hypothetical protein